MIYGWLGTFIVDDAFRYGAGIADVNVIEESEEVIWTYTTPVFDLKTITGKTIPPLAKMRYLPHVYEVLTGYSVVSSHLEYSLDALNWTSLQSGDNIDVAVVRFVRIVFQITVTSNLSDPILDYAAFQIADARVDWSDSEPTPWERRNYPLE